MESSPAKGSKTKEIIPSELSKSPSLEELVTKFLVLQFGEERVLNVSPLTEMAKKNDTVQMLLWNLKVDNEEAALSVQADGSAWVFNFNVTFLTNRTLNLNQKILSEGFSFCLVES